MWPDWVVVLINECVVEWVVDECGEERFEVAEIDEHSVVGCGGVVNDFAGAGCLEFVAVAVWVATFCLVVGDAVAGIPFDGFRNIAGDSHWFSIRIVAVT